MYDNCLNCGGLIFPPGILVGYAGPVCLCPKDPKHQYQRPASKEAPARLAQEKGVMEMSPEESKKHNEAMLSFFGDEKAAAPGEESWEKLKQESAGADFEQAFGRQALLHYGHGFDAAITLVAKPLLADLTESKRLHKVYEDTADKLAEKLIRNDAELSSLKAENAALREENTYLKGQLEIADNNCEDAERNWEESVDDFHDLQEVEKSLRQQLADAVELIKFYRDIGCSKEDMDKDEARYQAFMSKLKAPSDAGEGKKRCPPHSWDQSGERCTKCGDKDWMT